jgi:hypothetical protein
MALDLLSVHEPGAHWPDEAAPVALPDGEVNTARPNLAPPMALNRFSVWEWPSSGKTSTDWKICSQSATGKHRVSGNVRGFLDPTRIRRATHS